MFFYCGPVPELKTVRLTHGRFLYCFAALFAGLFFASLAAAQQGIPLTLAEAEDISSANEPGRAALLARAAAYGEQAAAAGELPDPTFRMGLGNFPISSGGFSTEGMTQAQLGLRQVFTGSRARALDSERLHAMAAERTRSAEARSRDVLAATRIAWLETYYWQRAQQILNESRPFFEDLVNVTRSMYAVGRKSQHDVLRAELELSRLDDRLIEAGRARAEAQARLSQWLGQDAFRPVVMRLPGWPRPPTLEDLESRIEQHPGVVAADALVEARRSTVGLAEESFKPDWALDIAYGYREGFLPGGEPRSDFISISVSVDLPVSRENRQGRKLAAALSERRAAQEQSNEVRAQMRSDLGLQHARWSDLNRRLALYENRILGQSKGQAQAAMLAYQSDAGDFSDVMRGSVDDLNTRLEYTRLKVERAQSYAVLANLGGISR